MRQNIIDLELVEKLILNGQPSLIIAVPFTLKFSEKLFSPEFVKGFQLIHNGVKLGTQESYLVKDIPIW